jgi:hypothetical protein
MKCPGRHGDCIYHDACVALIQRRGRASATFIRMNRRQECSEYRGGGGPEKTTSDTAKK